MKILDEVLFRLFQITLYLVSLISTFLLRSFFLIVLSLGAYFGLKYLGFSIFHSLLIIATLTTILVILDSVFNLNIFNPKKGALKTRALISSYQSFSYRSLNDAVVEKFISLDRSHEMMKKFESELEETGVFDLSSDEKAKEVERILLKIVTEIGKRNN